MAHELEMIEAMSVLRIEPGDIVVIKCAQLLSSGHTKALEAAIKQRIGDHEVLVLSGGLDIGVLRKEAA